jgi:hypothetical protein
MFNSVRKSLRSLGTRKSRVVPGETGSRSPLEEKFKSLAIKFKPPAFKNIDPYQFYGVNNAKGGKRTKSRKNQNTRRNKQ